MPFRFDSVRFCGFLLKIILKTFVFDFSERKKENPPPSPEAAGNRKLLEQNENPISIRRRSIENRIRENRNRPKVRSNHMEASLSHSQKY